MYVPLQEIMIVLYLLVENYVHERRMTLMFYSDSKFFEAVNALEITEESIEPEELTLELNNHVEVPPVEVSKLDDNANDLLREIAEEVSGYDEEHMPPYNIYEEDGQMYIEEEVLEPQEISNNIDSAKNIPTPVMEQWTVRLTSIDGSSIQVYDGNYHWLNITAKKARRLEEDSILLLFITKEEEEIYVRQIMVLEQSINEDYAIPDEDIRYSSGEAI